MDNARDKLAALSAQGKRALLEALLRDKVAGGAAKPGAYRFPIEYTIMRKRLEAPGDEGVSDLFFRNFEGINGSTARSDGTEFVNFCSYNYLGMSGDPKVSAAAVEAIATYGTSVSASRVVSGERPLHRQLEQALMERLGTEDALVFVGGFSTNEDTIGHLMGKGDVIVYDSLIHASVQQGAVLSGATVLPFPHGNMEALENILQRKRSQARHALIVAEGIYSMDGDIADLPRLIDIKKRHGAMLMVDEAHSMGVLGETGGGIREYFGADASDVDLWMGTLSKALASCGGYIAGSKDMITYLRLTAPGFVYSVGIAPPQAAAALASLKLMREEPQRVTRLHERSRLFHRLAAENDLDTGDSSPDAAAIPVMMGDSERAIRVSRALAKQGILVLPIGFPAVPENKARLRFFFSTNHSEDDIRRAVGALAEVRGRRGSRG